MEKVNIMKKAVIIGLILFVLFFIYVATEDTDTSTDENIGTSSSSSSIPERNLSSSSTTSDTKDAKKTVTSFFDALCDGDVDKALTYCHEDSQAWDNISPTTKDKIIDAMASEFFSDETTKDKFRKDKNILTILDTLSELLFKDYQIIEENDSQDGMVQYKIKANRMMEDISDRLGDIWEDVLTTYLDANLAEAQKVYEEKGTAGLISAAFEKESEEIARKNKEFIQSYDNYVQKSYNITVSKTNDKWEITEFIRDDLSDNSNESFPNEQTSFVSPVTKGLFIKIGDSEIMFYPIELKIDEFPILFHQSYIEENNIDANFISDRKKIVSKIESALKEEPCYISVNDEGIFGQKYYCVTKSGLARYYGKTKDNRPHGFGVLTYIGTNFENCFEYLVYAGEFNKGRYDGYGVAFNEPVDGISAYECANPVKAKAYVSYDGMWEDGDMTGKGNEFLFDEEWGEFQGVVISDFKSGHWDGKTKIYNNNGALFFEGNMEEGKMNGKGTTYFTNGQKKYDGEWKDGMYHGKGKLYDKDGKVIYSGKWKYGDYAS